MKYKANRIIVQARLSLRPLIRHIINTGIICQFLRKAIRLVFNGLRDLAIQIMEGRKRDWPEKISGRQLIVSSQPHQIADASADIVDRAGYQPRADVR